MGRSNVAVGKNKGLKIGGKKGAKKKIVDPFTRKDWYDIKAPSVFKVRQVGKTLVNRTRKANARNRHKDKNAISVSVGRSLECFQPSQRGGVSQFAPVFSLRKHNEH